MEPKKMGMEAKKTEFPDVSAQAISTELRVFSRQRWPLANDKYRKARLKDLLEMTSRRIKSLWEGEETAVPRAHETARIERLIGKKIGAPHITEEEADAVRRSQENYRALEARLASLEALYARFDPELVGQHVAGARAFARGEVGSAVSRGEGDGPDRSDRS